MAKKVAPLVSGAGQFLDFVSHLAGAIRRRGGDPGECVERVVKDGGNQVVFDQFADLIVSAKRAVSKFKVFKTIKLGTGLVTADDFRRALKQAGHRVGDWANDILGQQAFKAADKETEVDLVVVSVAELGFPNRATRQDIYQKGQELGLMLCPPEVGPQLCLQYPDQPNGEWLLIGMEPIADSDGYLRVFFVARGDDGSWLYGYYGGPDSVWDGASRWVFLRRR